MKKNHLAMWSMIGIGVIALCYGFFDQPLSDFLFTHHIRTYLMPIKHMAEWPPFMSGLAPLIFVSMLCVMACKKTETPRWVCMFFLMALSLMLSYLLKNELKWVFSRYWPETWVHDNVSWIRDRAYGFQWFQGPLLKGDDVTGSFPSGHTTAAFATFLSIGLWYRRWLVACVALASLEGLLMVFFDYHFLSDVLAGALLGMLCTLLCYYVMRVSMVLRAVDFSNPKR